MLNLMLLIYHAISGLRKTLLNIVASLSCIRDLLMSGSLQQNATINEWRKRLRACAHPDRKH